MSINKLYNRVLMIASFLLWSLPLIVNGQTTFNCQKGASGRPLTTVRMYTNENTKNDADTIGIKMQSTHELRQIIYINQGETKKFRLQTTTGVGYFRWFRYDSHVALNTSYFSYTGTATNYGADGRIYTQANTNATVTSNMLSAVPSKPTVIACDVSNYSDKTKSDGTTYSEPTLYYRMIYELRPATEMAGNLNQCTDINHCLETYSMIAPSGGQQIIMGPQYPYSAETGGFQSNYYVGTTSLTQITSGTWYEVDVSSGAKNPLSGTLYNAKQYQFKGSTSKGTHIYVLISTVSGKDYYIAKFIVDYQDITKVGPSATEIYSNTYLSSHYKEIAARRFDFNKAKDDKQAWSEPLSFDESTYGFIYQPYNYTANYSNNTTMDLKNVSFPSINWANYAFLSSSANIGNWAYTTFHDRLFERTGQQGYFYYVDAAETQGLVSKLDISQACCAGTGLFFSAWVANVNKQGNLPPNLNFEISALDENGNEINVKTFTTGNFGNTSSASDNKWMQVYFNFEIPRGTNYKKLYLKVINNQVSSSGDDFIIDDIVAYMEKPAIEAEQTASLCGPTAQIKVHINYNQMLKLAAMDGLPQADSLTVGYCFVDSTKYITEINQGIDKAVALSDARVKINNSTTGNTYIGKFILRYNPSKGCDQLYADASGKTYDQIITELQKIPYALHELRDGKDELFCLLEITGYDLEPGKRYFTIFNINGTAIDDMASYSVDKPCDAYTSFILKGSGRIIVDGSTDLYEENGNHCYNQTPSFTVQELSYIDENGNTAWVKTQQLGLYFDWYKGTEMEYHNAKYTEGNSSFSIADALLSYRLVYPLASNISLPALGVYTEAKRKVIMDLATDGTGDNSTLVLKKKSYSPFMPSFGKYYYLAIPVVATFSDPESKYSVCLDEEQIVYNATDQAPKILFGIPGVGYADRSIVPIRMGLNQLNNMTSSAKVLTVPIRQIGIVTEGSHLITIHDSGHSLKADSLFLVDTDDPAMVNDALNFKKVGNINILSADNRLANTSNNINNLMKIYFDIGFASSVKEGYTYKIKAFYAERNAVNTDYTNTCEGNAFIVLKVVPAFENWHGGASVDNQDWNNDDNWRRSDNAELYKGIEYMSNSANTTSKGFVPLNFTNVTILKGDSVSSVPVLRSHALNTDNVLNLDESTSTKDIAYDMVVSGDAGNFKCIGYYENVCADLYMKPESELMNAQLLIYQKAHVDYELTPNRWYLLSSPLKGVYAGDMYAPTGTVRQETDAFTDIRFDNSLLENSRFDPAIYQRSWDKNSSIVYTYVPGGIDGKQNVYARAKWSNVYNDVDVPYVSGNGFSIKVVPKTWPSDDSKTLFRLPKADTEYYYFTANGVKGNSKIIDRTGSGRFLTDDLTSSSSTTVRVSNSSTDNNLFLVGNPFPCQLDMASFFDANSTFIDSKYWLMTADSQDAVVFGDNVISTNGTSGKTVSPMQGFFVKVKDGVPSTSSLDLIFTKDMMTGLSSGLESPLLRAKSYNAQSITGKLQLTVTCNGAESRATLVRNAKASDSFVSKEDVELLDCSLVSNIPLIYSVAGKTAVQINQFKSNAMIPVGVMHGDSEVVNVSISGVLSFNGNLALYDATEHSYTPLKSDTVVPFISNVPDRYFISFSPSTGIDALSSASIDFYTPAQGELRVVASSGSPLQEITIIGVGGVIVAKRISLHSVSETFTLPMGMYIVKARTNQDTKIGKITIRQ